MTIDIDSQRKMVEEIEYKILYQNDVLYPLKGSQIIFRHILKVGLLTLQTRNYYFSI